jgi:hypothetical protein
MNDLPGAGGTGDSVNHPSAESKKRCLRVLSSGRRGRGRICSGDDRLHSGTRARSDSTFTGTGWQRIAPFRFLLTASISRSTWL